MTTPHVTETRVQAVNEPGFPNVWYIQTGNGATVARLTVDSEAGAWAQRIEGALNRQLSNAAPVEQSKYPAVEQGSDEWDAKFRWKPYEVVLSVVGLVVGLTAAVVSMSFQPLVACVVYPVMRAMAVSAEVRDDRKRQRKRLQAIL